LGDHERVVAGLAVGVGGVERGVFGASLVGLEGEPPAGAIAAERLFVAAVAERGLIVLVGGVAGADVAGQLAAERTIPTHQDGRGCKLFFRRSDLDEWRRSGGRAAHLSTVVSHAA
jgi:hypothetical protein